MLRHLGKAIDARAEKLVAHLPGALKGDAEDAHDARVASRRLAEVLPLLNGRRADRLQADVRVVRQTLGEQRELAVTLALLTEEAARWRWHPALVARVARHIEATRAKVDARARKRARSIDLARLRRRLTRVAGQAAEEAYPELMARLRARRTSRARALARAVAAAGSLYDVDRLHVVRIQTKKMRYILEAQVECAGRGPSAQIGALKELQAELGRLHDLQVLEGTVREVESRLVSGRGRVARGLGAMATDLETECRRLHALVLTAIRDVGRASARRA